MLKLLYWRALDLIVVLIGVSLLVFLMIRLIPGDAAQVMLGASGEASNVQVQELRSKLGLDLPLPVQYAKWIGDMLQGQFGQSIWTGEPVLNEIGARIGVTLELTFLSLLLAILVSIPAGAIMAYFRGSRVDLLMRLVTITGVTMPGFWLGALLIFGWAIWFPGWQTLGSIPPWAEDPWSHMQRMFLPVLTCALPIVASLSRIMRSAMLDALGQDYIRTARAKGLNEWVVTFKHAMRNSLIPYVTALGITAGYLFSGAIVVEQVFAIPGLGRLMLGAIADRNYPLIQASILVVTVGFVAINAVIDLLYRVIDKRAGVSL